MITHIKGRLSEKSPTNVVIETNGIGYWVNISLTTFSQIPDQESIKLYTHLQIKEDSHSLYGFYTMKEREIFRLLISVSGVGTSTARTMLNDFRQGNIGAISLESPATREIMLKRFAKDQLDNSSQV